jgi:nucleoside-diphosphate-sugar epimerase
MCEVIPRARVELVPPEPGEAVKRYEQPLDLSRSRTELGYEPEYSLERALADYLGKRERD